MKISPSFKKYLGFVLKLLLAAGIIAFLFRDPKKIIACFHHFDLRYLAPAMIFYGAHISYNALIASFKFCFSLP